MESKPIDEQIKELFDAGVIESYSGITMSLTPPPAEVDRSNFHGKIKLSTNLYLSETFKHAQRDRDNGMEG